MAKVLVILDGIGDKPCKVLKGKTPLEAAKTPYLDSLTRQGNSGTVFPVGKDIAPESDVAVTALLGYDPYKYYTGRGPLESFGAGISFKQGNLALRTNFSTVNEDMTLLDRRAGRTLTTKEAGELSKTINKEISLDVPFTFQSTVEHRGILVFEGKLSGNISNVDPAYEKVGSFGVARGGEKNKIAPCKALDPTPETKKSAKLINEFVQQSYDILKKHPVNIKRSKNYLLPANIILPRDAGTALPIFPKKKDWGAVVSMPLEKGLAKLAGMNVLPFTVPPLTTTELYEHLYVSLDLTIKTAKKVLSQGKYSHYYIHIKETDIPGHDNRPLDKKKMIELLDKEFFSFLHEQQYELILTGDHSTPCEEKKHSHDPVPLLWVGKPKKDTVERFTEKECKKGSLKTLYGKEVLNITGFE